MGPNASHDRAEHHRPRNNGDYVFDKLPEPPKAAEVDQAWMRMLTLQLGILLKPYLTLPTTP